MTAHAMTGDEQKSRDAGMNDHITKPIDPDQLFKSLQKWITPKENRISDRKPDRTDKHAGLTPVATVTEELPESLPGFDLTAGLKRLRGNQRLYRKLLVDFAAHYSETTGEIHDALAAGDLKQAHSLVHNLKGTAGNLEATDLHAAAVEMEKFVRGQPGETDTHKELNRKLADLEDALNRALEAVKPLGPPLEKKTIGNSDDTMTSLPPELAKKAAERIVRAVEMGDVSQIKSIAESLGSESEAFSPVCDKLIQLAEDFDLDGILKLAQELDK